MPGVLVEMAVLGGELTRMSSCRVARWHGGTKEAEVDPVRHEARIIAHTIRIQAHLRKIKKAESLDERLVERVELMVRVLKDCNLWFR